jgi:hypothetical protein
MDIRSANRCNIEFALFNWEEKEMEIAELALGYAEVLIWPVITLIILFSFRKAIISLLPGSKVRFQFSGVTIETTLARFEEIIGESFRGKKMSTDQWEWLGKLAKVGRVQYKSEYYDQLSPLRNAGLIWEHPEGWLSTANEVSISPLGELLLEAWERDHRK